jgi:hypothetical protein
LGDNAILDMVNVAQGIIVSGAYISLYFSDIAKPDKIDRVSDIVTDTCYIALTFYNEAQVYKWNPPYDY